MISVGIDPGKSCGLAKIAMLDRPMVLESLTLKLVDSPAGIIEALTSLQPFDVLCLEDIRFYKGYQGSSGYTGQGGASAGFVPVKKLRGCLEIVGAVKCYASLRSYVLQIMGRPEVLTEVFGSGSLGKSDTKKLLGMLLSNPAELKNQHERDAASAALCGAARYRRDLCLAKAR